VGFTCTLHARRLEPKKNNGQWGGGYFSDVLSLCLLLSLGVDGVERLCVMWLNILLLTIEIEGLIRLLLPRISFWGLCLSEGLS